MKEEEEEEAASRSPLSKNSNPPDPTRDGVNSKVDLTAGVSSE
jgi:hypothetical protein